MTRERERKRCDQFPRLEGVVTPAEGGVPRSSGEGVEEWATEECELELAGGRLGSGRGVVD